MNRLLLLLVIALASGCGGTSSGTPTRGPTTTPPPALVIFPTPPSGWRVHSTPVFQLALPEAWLQVALSEESLRANIRAAQGSNPDLARALQDLYDSGQYKGLDLYAADRQATGIVTNVTVTHAAPGGATRSEDVANTSADSLRRSIPGLKVLSTTPLVSVNGIDAAQLQYELPFRSPGGQPANLRGVQFLFLVSPQDLYVVNISGDGNNPDLVPLAEQIGKSFVAVKK